ncbi:MAG: hypothetical protein ACOYK9_01230 [Chlamydiia bacterium]
MGKISDSTPRDYISSLNEISSHILKMTPFEMKMAKKMLGIFQAALKQGDNSAKLKYAYEVSIGPLVKKDGKSHGKITSKIIQFFNNLFRKGTMNDFKKNIDAATQALTPPPKLKGNEDSARTLVALCKKKLGKSKKTTLNKRDKDLQEKLTKLEDYLKQPSTHKSSEMLKKFYENLKHEYMQHNQKDVNPIAQTVYNKSSKLKSSTTPTKMGENPSTEETDQLLADAKNFLDKTSGHKSKESKEARTSVAAAIRVLERQIKDPENKTKGGSFVIQAFHNQLKTRMETAKELFAEKKKSRAKSTPSAKVYEKVTTKSELKSSKSKKPKHFTEELKQKFANDDKPKG